MHGSPPGGDSPGKNSGMGGHFLLQGIFLILELNPRSPALQTDNLLTESEVAQLCPTLCDPVDCRESLNKTV